MMMMTQAMLRAAVLVGCAAAAADLRITFAADAGNVTVCGDPTAVFDAATIPVGAASPLTPASASAGPALDGGDVVSAPLATGVADAAGPSLQVRVPRRT